MKERDVLSLSSLQKTLKTGLIIVLINGKRPGHREGQSLTL